MFNPSTNSEIVGVGNDGKVYRGNLFPSKQLIMLKEQNNILGKNPKFLKVLRLGKFWKIIICSQNLVEALGIEDFERNWMAKKFMDNCNDNTSGFKNK